ncbi:PREDICTED: uncharacterized protein LOC106811915 [Priapulus caudatus]|uniref:Uncharacterized protein LOC106811915 n=1 Tax=Priapulus caudatus TaxID=37621 RepID=A0ABM1EG20_PRICU|nr:PREDICTED: uncharacterized protein LOC106811915 [Priapulus caudatus]
MGDGNTDTVTETHTISSEQRVEPATQHNETTGFSHRAAAANVKLGSRDGEDATEDEEAAAGHPGASVRGDGGGGTSEKEKETAVLPAERDATVRRPGGASDDTDDAKLERNDENLAESSTEDVGAADSRRGGDVVENNRTAPGLVDGKGLAGGANSADKKTADDKKPPQGGDAHKRHSDDSDGNNKKIADGTLKVERNHERSNETIGANEQTSYSESDNSHKTTKTDKNIADSTDGAREPEVNSEAKQSKNKDLSEIRSSNEADVTKGDGISKPEKIANAFSDKPTDKTHQHADASENHREIADDKNKDESISDDNNANDDKRTGKNAQQPHMKEEMYSHLPSSRESDSSLHADTLVSESRTLGLEELIQNYDDP